MSADDSFPGIAELAGEYLHTAGHTQLAQRIATAGLYLSPGEAHDTIRVDLAGEPPLSAPQQQQATQAVQNALRLAASWSVDNIVFATEPAALPR